MITQAQVNTGLRYAGVVAGTLGSVAVVLGTLDAHTASGIVAAFQQLVSDLQLVVGDFYKLAVLVCPIVVGWLAQMGVRSSSPKSQVASVQSLPAAQVLVSDPKLLSPGVTLVPSSQIANP